MNINSSPAAEKIECPVCHKTLCFGNRTGRHAVRPVTEGEIIMPEDTVLSIKCPRHGGSVNIIVSSSEKSSA